MGNINVKFRIDYFCKKCYISFNSRDMSNRKNTCPIIFPKPSKFDIKLFPENTFTEGAQVHPSCNCRIGAFFIASHARMQEKMRSGSSARPAEDVSNKRAALVFGTASYYVNRFREDQAHAAMPLRGVKSRFTSTANHNLLRAHVTTAAPGAASISANCAFRYSPLSSFTFLRKFPTADCYFYRGIVPGLMPRANYSESA